MTQGLVTSLHFTQWTDLFALHSVQCTHIHFLSTLFFFNQFLIKVTTANDKRTPDLMSLFFMIMFVCVFCKSTERVQKLSTTVNNNCFFQQSFLLFPWVKNWVVCWWSEVLVKLAISRRHNHRKNRKLGKKGGFVLALPSQIVAAVAVSLQWAPIKLKLKFERARLNPFAWIKECL